MSRRVLFNLFLSRLAREPLEPARSWPGFCLGVRGEHWAKYKTQTLTDFHLWYLLISASHKYISYILLESWQSICWEVLNNCLFKLRRRQLWVWLLRAAADAALLPPDPGHAPRLPLHVYQGNQSSLPCHHNASRTLFFALKSLHKLIWHLSYC